jgi:hypothetical protein
MHSQTPFVIFMSRFVRRLPSELIPKLFFEMVEELLYISRICRPMGN